MALLDRYTVRRRFFTLLGQEFNISGPSGDPLFYTRLKPFKLREEITLYTGVNLDEPVMEIRARKIIDFSGAYDVTDLGTGERIGMLQRMGIRSVFRDRWRILNANDEEVAQIDEDSMALALLRRFLAGFVPQTFAVTSGGTAVGVLRQRFNPFILTLEVDYSADTERRLDRRLGLAAAVLLGAIEGRESNG